MCFFVTFFSWSIYETLFGCAVCDANCISDCTSAGAGKCDSSCNAGYSLDTSTHTCIRKLVTKCCNTLNCNEKWVLYCMVETNLIVPYWTVFLSTNSTITFTISSVNIFWLLVLDFFGVNNIGCFRVCLTFCLLRRKYWDTSSLNVC